MNALSSDGRTDGDDVPVTMLLHGGEEGVQRLTETGKGWERRRNQGMKAVVRPLRKQKLALLIFIFSVFETPIFHLSFRSERREETR